MGSVNEDLGLGIKVILYCGPVILKLKTKCENFKLENIYFAVCCILLCWIIALIMAYCCLSAIANAVVKCT